MVTISASLLAADPTCLKDEVSRAEQAGVDSFHVDVMDGHYVPNLALTPHHIPALARHTSLPFHMHLEIDNPDYLLEAFPPSRAACIIVHIETCADPVSTFQRIRAQNAQVGIAVNRNDEVTAITPLIPQIDLLVIMAVEAGFGGQEFDPRAYAKIGEARTVIDRLGCRAALAVDGGITHINARDVIGAGADILVIGSSLFRAGEMASFVDDVRRQASLHEIQGAT